ncbi:MAG: glycosyltransferase family 2 protein [Akkermansiaceae bacterium]|nr:glycosyltransferase family 2 protein [Akkermansiaceae bacterium]
MQIPSPAISVVIPVYRAESIVGELVSRLVSTLESMETTFEILLVEDRGPDRSWEAILEAASADSRVKGIRLARNFGQHFALTAGLDHALGEHVVVMDCDLQDDPADIPALYAKALEGHDIVLGIKDERRHATYRNLLSRLFFSAFNLLADNQTANINEGSFSVLSRRTVNAFRQYKDTHRHYLMILRNMGFPRATVIVHHRQRFEGHSSYSFRKLFRLALDGVTSQSTKLLRISIGLGFAYVLAAIGAVAYLLVRYFAFDEKPTTGWSSTIVLLLASTGLILMALGILGLYIGNIYEQVKGRPLYVVAAETNMQTTDHPNP